MQAESPAAVAAVVPVEYSEVVRESPVIKLRTAVHNHMIHITSIVSSIEAAPRLPFEQITPSALRMAAWSYPTQKSLGADGWHPWGIAILPDAYLQLFCDCFHRFACAGAWPTCFVNIMAVLIKLAGGHRTVAKTPYVLQALVQLEAPCY